MPIFSIPEDVIDVWRFDWSDWSDSFLEQMHPWLSTEECQQAERYKITADRRRFCVGRAMLRHLSGFYLERDGKALQIAINEYGKPRWQDFDEQLCFNISHSGAWVVIAFSAGRHVGIDVQKIDTRPGFDFTTISKHFFHPAEKAAIDNSPEENQRQKFYDIWTCKEAVIKAIGTGQHGELMKFSVLPIADEDEWNIVKCTEICNEPENYPAVKLLKVASGYAGALAVQGSYPITKIRKLGLSDSGYI